MIVAYSYIRFSSPEQRNGDSLRRQQAESSKWAVERGIQLDQSLNINDLGISAFRGKNVMDGGLGAFLAAIDSGRVKKGSYLLVENLDRLTRMEPTEALHLLQSIVKRGVTVVTLSDGREYTDESLNRDIAHLIMSIITMHRAHEESRLKGQRVRAAWHTKKQVDARAGRPITSMTPSWIQLRDGKLEVIEEKAKTVQYIFDLATCEGLGQRAIVTRLKKEGVPPIGRIGTWTETSIRRIIQNKAAIGIYQPRSTGLENPDVRHDDGDAIDAYFPPVVTRQQFYFAQTLREKALIPRGPRGEKLGTVFTGLVFCGCGATMRRKGASKYDVFIRLRCAASCGAQSWKYDPLHTLVMCFFEADMMPHLDNNSSERVNLQEQIAEMEEVVRSKGQAVKRLTDAIEQTNLPMDVLVRRLHEVTLELEVARSSVNRLAKELRSLEARNFMHDVGAAVGEDSEGLREIFGGKSSEISAEKIRYALSRAVDRIILSDEKGVRVARFEVGSEVRHIEFDRATLKIRCREDQNWKANIGVLHPVTKQIIAAIP